MADRDDSTGLPDQPWTMPGWMESYRGLVQSGTSLTAEDLIERLRVGGARLSQVNWPVYLMALEVDTKVRLLTALYQGRQLAWAKPSMYEYVEGQRRDESSLADPGGREPCGCLTNVRGSHRRNCPDWELVGSLTDWLRGNGHFVRRQTREETTP